MSHQTDPRVPHAASVEHIAEVTYEGLRTFDRVFGYASLALYERRVVPWGDLTDEERAQHMHTVATVMIGTAPPVHDVPPLARRRDSLLRGIVRALAGVNRDVEGV